MTAVIILLEKFLEHHAAGGFASRKVLFMAGSYTAIHVILPQVCGQDHISLPIIPTRRFP